MNRVDVDVPTFFFEQRWILFEFVSHLIGFISANRNTEGSASRLIFGAWSSLMGVVSITMARRRSGHMYCRWLSTLLARLCIKNSSFW